MLEPGQYRARARSYQWGKSSKNNEQVGIEFELLDEAFQGQTATWYGTFTDKAFEITVKALRTCGWTGDDLTSLSGLTDNEVTLVVEHEEYEGKVSAKVRWVNPIGGLAMKTPMNEGEVKAFGARMKGKLLALGQGQPRPKSAPSPKTDEESSPFNEDIPF